MVDGEVQTKSIIEILTKNNMIMYDIPWIASNQPLSHIHSIRTGLPGVTLRKYNQGVTPTKSTSEQRTETMTNIEARAEVDKDMAAINGNTEKWRASEEAPFIEAMEQEFVDQLFYGDPATAELEMLGFSPRYWSLGSSKSEAYAQIIDAGGTSTDNASIWLIGWGENSVTGIYPKGTNMGLQSTDLGEIDCFDASSRRFRGYGTLYKWQAGLAVKNYKNIVRIANIDYSDLQTVGNVSPTNANLVKMLMLAMDMLHTPDSVKKVFYCSRQVYTYLKQVLMNHPRIQIGWGELVNPLTGVKSYEMQFMGIPVRMCEALGVAEARITT
jgi:hypothetical protein